MCEIQGKNENGRSLREIIINERFKKEIGKFCENFATRVLGKFDLCEIDVISCFLGYKQGRKYRLYVVLCLPTQMLFPIGRKRHVSRVVGQNSLSL